MSQLTSFLLVLSLCAFAPLCFSSKTKDIGGSIVSEKGSNPSRNSIRGFEVLDEIKSALDKECPCTVSCADLLAIDARESTVLAGSHTIGNARCTSFRQRLYKLSGNGQPDYTLDQSYAAQLKIRCPKSGGDQNLFFLDYVSPTKFDNYYYKNILASKGLLSSDQVLLTKNEGSREMVKKYAENSQLFFEQFAKSRVKMGNISPLTGSHTIGNARCTNFRQRLYNQSGNGQPDYTLDQSYAAQLKIRCPKSGGDQNLFFLDYVSPTKFDNYHYKNILASKGLLNLIKFF
nr:peroxidase 72 [Quercus suber]